MERDCQAKFLISFGFESGEVHVQKRRPCSQVISAICCEAGWVGGATWTHMDKHGYP